MVENENKHSVEAEIVNQSDISGNEIKNITPKPKKNNLWIYAILIIIAGFLYFYPEYLRTFIILAIGSIIILGIIWYKLAPSEILYNFMQESTGKVKTRGGAFAGALIQKDGFTYDEYWRVVPEDDKHKEPWHIGGLRFNGIPFVDEIFRFPKKRISDSLEPGFEDEIVSSFSVKPEQYKFKIVQAETVSSQKTRMDLDVLFKGTIENPFKFFFGAPDNAIDKCIISLNAFFTNLIATKTQNDIFAVRKNPSMLWEEIKNDKVIKDLRVIQGFRIEENSVQFENIQMQDAVQKAAEERGIEQDKATARAEKITGTLLATMANIQGKTIPEIQDEIKASEELQKVFLQVVIDFSGRQLAIDGKSFLDIRGLNKEGDSLVGSLVQAMAILNKTNLGDKKEDATDKKAGAEEKPPESEKEDKEAKE